MVEVREILAPARILMESLMSRVFPAWRVLPVGLLPNTTIKTAPARSSLWEASRVHRERLLLHLRQRQLLPLRQRQLPLRRQHRLRRLQLPLHLLRHRHLHQHQLRRHHHRHLLQLQQQQPLQLQLQHRRQQAHLATHATGK